MGTESPRDDLRPPKGQRSSAFVLAAAYTAWSAFYWLVSSFAAYGPYLFGSDVPGDVTMFVRLNGIAIIVAALGLGMAFSKRPAVAVTALVSAAFLIQIGALFFIDIA